jgi:DNA-binding response OmpR family regulator
MRILEKWIQGYEKRKNEKREKRLAEIQVQADLKLSIEQLKKRIEAKPGGVRFLIIENERAIADVIRYILENAGIECRWLPGKEKITPAGIVEEIRTFQPHVISTCFTMPILNGIEVVQLIKKEMVEEPAILVISAESDPLTITRFVDLGIADYIIKPFEEGYLLTHLQKVLERKKII